MKAYLKKKEILVLLQDRSIEFRFISQEEKNKLEKVRSKHSFFERVTTFSIENDRTFIEKFDKQFQEHFLKYPIQTQSNFDEIDDLKKLLKPIQQSLESFLFQPNQLTNTNQENTSNLKKEEDNTNQILDSEIENPLQKKLRDKYLLLQQEYELLYKDNPYLAREDTEAEQNLHMIQFIDKLLVNDHKIRKTELDAISKKLATLIEFNEKNR